MPIHTASTTPKLNNAVTPPTMTQPTSCMGGATPPPHSHQPYCQPLHLRPAYPINGQGTVPGTNSMQQTLQPTMITRYASPRVTLGLFPSA